jgi:prepilin-type processing-associated H-X9-DG protein
MWEWFNPQAYSRFIAVTRTNMNRLTQFPVWPKAINIGDSCGDGYQWLFSIGGHSGITNFGFLDGHVKGMPYSRLWNTIKGTYGTGTSGDNWNGLAPNMMHYDEKFH